MSKNKEDNFAIFDQINLKIKAKEVKLEVKIKTKNIKLDCTHKNSITENEIKLCIDCGLEITRDISFEKEWRYYGANDNKNTNDPSRCNIRKIEERNIYKDVESMGFNDKVTCEANRIFQIVCEDQIHRGNFRKSIIFGCIFKAYELEEKPQSCEKLIKVFHINRKLGLKGLKKVNLSISKNKKKINLENIKKGDIDKEQKITKISPRILVDEIMDDFNATKEQKNEVFILYKKIKNTSSILNRARPKSVAAGLIFYYILKQNKNINIKNFVLKVGLSELTVNKISKEINRIIEGKINNK